MRRSIRPILPLAAVLTVLCAIPPAQGGQPPRFRAEVPLLDSIDVIVREHSVLAVSAETGAYASRAKLEPGEAVLWVGVRGRIGLVVTNRRLLAISRTAPIWQNVHFKARETLPQSILLGERVGVVATSHHLYGISAAGGLLKVHELGAYEKLQEDLVGDNLAVIVTDRRLIAMSGFAGGFFEEPVGVHEDLDYANASADFATVATDRRLVVFRAESGDWLTRPLPLHD